MHFAGLDRALKNPLVQAEDIEVTSASGIHATPIAEYCIGMMLAFNLKIPDMLRYQGDGKWAENAHDVFRPTPLRNKTLGIAGYGSIGRELARLAQSFGMRVLASKRDPRKPEDSEYSEPGLGDPMGDIPERIYPGEALATMARDCDYLVVTLPLTKATHHIINEDVFKAMKKTAVIINIARGEVIDEAAMISALAAEKIGGAALDVFEQEPLPAGSPLWNFDNVIISPHVSGNNTDYHRRAAALFIENLKRYIEKRPLFNRLERERGY
jgi:phosphoglycerate dehydrogenase-like enzyme